MSDDGGNPDDIRDVIMDFGNHPLMDRVQEALYKQLLTTYERLDGEYREKAEDLRKIKKEREDVGVQLYGLQQQLARLQMALESSHNKFNEIVAVREDEESKLENMRVDMEEQQERVKDAAKQVVKNQAELDALNETLRQVEAYNEEMRGEIAITRRAAYKAEESIQQLEKGKETQDFYLDRLTVQLSTLKEQIQVYKDALTKQQESTTEAENILRETAAEMEVIVFEKKQLLQQWRSALIGLTRRDEALTAAQHALADAELATKDYDTEIEGVRREIARAQAKNEELIQQKEKLENEEKFVQEQLTKATQERENLSERYTLLQKSLNASEEEEKFVATETVRLEQQLATLAQNVQVVTRERQKLEEGIQANKDTQTTVSKAARNLQKQEQKVQGSVHEKELETASMRNELSRIGVDKLNTEAHNAQLREARDRIVEELKAKEGLIEKYQMEIRQRNDAIEKKMYRVDRLNRKHEKLMENAEEEESMGPLEATIKNLKKELDASNTECHRLQREWLQDQTHMVATVTETDKEVEKNAELKARVTVLSQRQLRIIRETKREETERQRLEKIIDAMHYDMSRLNSLIGRNGKMGEDLKNNNVVTEQEFVRQLKDLEHESVQLEEKIRAVTRDKQELLSEVAETERQAMLWEKKIQLEKETQAALDPEAGMAETKAMEKEIHRMRLRLDTLKREQERLVKEMERAVFKREDIAVRYRKGAGAAGANKTGGGGGGSGGTGTMGTGRLARTKSASMAGTAGSFGRTGTGGKGRGVGGGTATMSEFTRAGLRKKLSSLRREVATFIAESEGQDRVMAERRGRLDELGSVLEERTAGYGRIEEGCANIQAGINNALYEKQRIVDKYERLHRLACRYEDLEAGRGPPMVPPSMAYESDRQLQDERTRMASIREVISSLERQFGHLGDVFGRVMALAEED